MVIPMLRMKDMIVKSKGSCHDFFKMEHFYNNSEIT